MDIRERAAMKQRAEDALAQASYSPHKLFFLHTAISLGLSAVIALLDFLLEGSIAGTGGLAGMQTRAMLSTAQSVLQLASSIALPFWQMGLIYASLQLLRQQTAGPGCLTEGFRRFRPVLRLLLMKGLLLMAAFVLCSYIGVMLFMLSPLSQSFMDALAPVVEAGDPAAMEALLNDTAFLESLVPQLLPLFGIVLAAIAIVCIPLSYRLRMTDLVVMDQDQTGAFGIIRESFRLTRRNCFALFRLDLSFWWFYLLNELTVLIYNLDWLLPSLGIALPVSITTAYWLCWGAYILLQLALYTWAGPKVQTTYAAAYEALRQAQTPPIEKPTE